MTAKALQENTQKTSKKILFSMDEKLQASSVTQNTQDKHTTKTFKKVLMSSF